MSAIFTPRSAEGFELCHPEQQEGFEKLNTHINGLPRRNGWKPISMQLITADEGKPLLPSDSPWLGSHALLFKRSAIAKIGSMLQTYGELLPTECAEEPLFIYNPTCMIDALDEQASSLLRFTDGAIMQISRYGFRPEIVAGVDIFKIPNLRVSPTFVSAAFVNLWNSSTLSGLDFNKIWCA